MIEDPKDIAMQLESEIKDFRRELFWGRACLVVASLLGIMFAWLTFEDCSPMTGAQRLWMFCRSGLPYVGGAVFFGLLYLRSARLRSRVIDDCRKNQTTAGQQRQSG